MKFASKNIEMTRNAKAPPITNGISAPGLKKDIVKTVERQRSIGTRIYKFEVPLGASHKTAFGEPHSHTFLIQLELSVSEGYMDFQILEKIVKLYFSPLGGELLNDIPEIGAAAETLEGLAKKFYPDLTVGLARFNIQLCRLSISDNATRIYSICDPKMHFVY